VKQWHELTAAERLARHLEAHKHAKERTSVAEVREMREARESQQGYAT
jgi:hypothetical protein